jgi:hypothetical protein
MGFAKELDETLTVLLRIGPACRLNANLKRPPVNIFSSSVVSFPFAARTAIIRPQNRDIFRYFREQYPLAANSSQVLCWTKE